MGARGAAPAHTHGSPQAQRERPDQGRAPTQVLAVLPVEGPRVAGGVLGGVVALLAPGPAAALRWIVDADQASFEAEVGASVPVLVDFWAAWCAPCRIVTPVVERLAHEHAGRLKVVKLDVDGAPEVAGRFGVQGIPLLVLIRDGQEVDRLVGAAPEPEPRRWLTERIGAPQPG